MTSLQHDLIKRMSLNENNYLGKRMRHTGRQGYMFYSGNANPEKWYSEPTVKALISVLKKDKHGRLTLNLNLVRQQHGKSLLKKFYKQKTKKNHGIRSNQSQKEIFI